MPLRHLQHNQHTIRTRPKRARIITTGVQSMQFHFLCIMGAEHGFILIPTRDKHSATHWFNAIVHQYCGCLTVPYKGYKTSVIWGVSCCDAAILQCCMHQHNFQVSNHRSNQRNRTILNTEIQQRSLLVWAVAADATVTSQNPQDTMPG